MSNDVSELLTFNDLKNYFGISRTSAYRWMSTDGFPKPIKLGPNSVRISRMAVQDWINSRPDAPVHGSEEAVA